MSTLSIRERAALRASYHRLGERERAKEVLASAEKTFEVAGDAMNGMPLGMLPAPWFDMVEFLQFYGEARRLVTGSPPPDNPGLRARRERALAALAESDPSPLLDSARAHARMGELAAAAVEYGRLLDLLPVSIWPYEIVGQVSNEVEARPEIFDALVGHRPDDARLWVARGRALARRKRWPEALAAYHRVMASRPPDDAMLEYACLQLLSGDTAGYRRLCTRLAEQYGNTSDLMEACALSRVCTLAEGAVADPARPIAWAELWTTRRPPLYFTTHAVGAAYYRAGRFEEAIRHLQESTAARSYWTQQSLNDVFLALAHSRLGQADEARSYLDKVDQWLADADRELAAAKTGFPPRVFPVNWLIVQVLRPEAAQVLAHPPSGAKTQ